MWFKNITLIFTVLCCLVYNYGFCLEYEEKISFWSETQKGANIFNKKVNEDDIKFAKEFGISFIRLAVDKFPTQNHDFLIGDADNYTELAFDDLEYLKELLLIFESENLPVVITMLSLPGSRWIQNNEDHDDLRIWYDESFQKQAAKFWKDLALELRDFDIVIGYNILNEPHPERLYNIDATHIYEIEQEAVQEKLNNFYNLIIHAIRSVDKQTPIILDSSAYADPNTFQHLIAHQDNNIVYSFHMYEPYEYTNYKINNSRFTYPGVIEDTHWNQERLRNYMNSVNKFQQTYNIPSNRILVGEFGGNRKISGLSRYFKDLIDIFKESEWHFAFYAFREDVWDGMDYELGDKALPWSYWQAVEQGKDPILNRNCNTSNACKVLKEEFK